MPIPIITNFNVNTSQPIDSRMVVINTTARNNITHKYDGLKVFVQSDRKTYVYNSNTLSWAVDGGGSGPLLDIQVGQGPLQVIEVETRSSTISGIIPSSSNFTALPAYWTKIDRIVSVSGNIMIDQLTNTSYTLRVEIPASFPVSDPNSVAGTGILRLNTMDPNNDNYSFNHMMCSISSDYMGSDSFVNIRFRSTGIGAPPLDQYLMVYNYSYMSI